MFEMKWYEEKGNDVYHLYDGDNWICQVHKYNDGTWGFSPTGLLYLSSDTLDRCACDFFNQYKAMTLEEAKEEAINAIRTTCSKVLCYYSRLRGRLDNVEDD